MNQKKAVSSKHETAFLFKNREICLFLEISVVQTFKTSSMTSFVTSHFMNSVVDSIQVQFFSTLSDTSLVSASTAFSIHAFFQVGFGIPNTITQQFCEFGSVFSFFPSVAFESFSDFGITFAIGLTAHSQIHTNFSAFTHKVVVQVFNHLFIATFCYTDSVFCDKLQ